MTPRSQGDEPDELLFKLRTIKTVLRIGFAGLVIARAAVWIERRRRAGGGVNDSRGLQRAHGVRHARR